jgi:predicted Rossmann fold nucleotide-binding protein DprA/Smf involved in DNA uptake
VGPPQRVAGGASIAPIELSAEARRLRDALVTEESLSAEELARALDLPAATVLAALFELEAAGLAVCDAGRYGAARR